MAEINNVSEINIIPISGVYQSVFITWDVLESMLKDEFINENELIGGITMNKFGFSVRIEKNDE